MAKKADVIEQESGERRIEHGGEEHAALLAGAYGMSVEEAETIISQREENPLTHPYDVYQKAKAMLAALRTKPVPISTDEGWKRDTDDLHIS